MGRYFLRRLIGIIPILLVVSILIFLFVHLIPVDPARLVAWPDARQENIEFIREDLGLNEIIYKHYYDFVTGIFKLDLWTFIKLKRPVFEEISKRFMPTFLLTVFSMIWASILGLVIGVVSSTKRNK